MWKNRKVSVILPAYNEAQNIRRSINEFFATGVVDEIIAVDNNSRDSTASEIKRTKAKLIQEKKQGYGNALQRGMKESSGYYIITAEPDGTFVSKDIKKLLLYSDDFDVVFGTRTSKSLIWDNAKMDWFLRIGNEAIAKLLEYLFNGPSLTDVGCTMKLINRTSFNKIKDRFTIGGSQFSPEFMILVIKNKIKCVEIPVNYKERIGDSKITSNFTKSFLLGLQMINLIIGYRFGYKGK